MAENALKDINRPMDVLGFGKCQLFYGLWRGWIYSLMKQI